MKKASAVRWKKRPIIKSVFEVVRMACAAGGGAAGGTWSCQFGRKKKLYELRQTS